MFNNQAVWRVEITFVATPPTRQVERASGVSEVVVDGHAVHCVVSGAFQPLLEALRGHEVIGLTSIPVLEAPLLPREGGDD